MVSKITTLLVVALSAISESAATLDKRIVGGERAKLGEVPFMVALEGPTGICGGTLLNSNTVLTAAHCRQMTIVKAGILVSLFTPKKYKSYKTNNFIEQNKQ